MTPPEAASYVENFEHVLARRPTVRRSLRTSHLTAIITAALAASLIVGAARAEPLIRIPLEQVSYRVNPAPFQVKTHHGRFQWGYGHVEFVAPGGVLRWGPWLKALDIKIAREAIELVEQRTIENERCNRYFADRMPGGLTLHEIWTAKGAARIRISYSPGPSGIWRAATYNDRPYEWTITQSAVRLGAESVAAAMVHEATRTNGLTHEAAVVYGAGQACGMRPYVISRLIADKLGWSMRTVR